ncbi:hypothetical protein F2P81_010113 [Scophthalmus maximus]|uniref:RING-type E3 ubiquitin transferase n=1 Tax=Scophthalmus maximus TaxID=52904 RepID=A0A6A4SWZ9_SCOMX|nr:hypothetical protein F2P81_010113 [Scophthalmus maximus]
MLFEILTWSGGGDWCYSSYKQQQQEQYRNIQTIPSPAYHAGRQLVVLQGIFLQQGRKAPGRSGSRSSNVSKASNSTTGQTTASRTSITPSSQDICRICHCEGDDECPLITPCHCTGSLSFVHQACLNQWIKSSDTRCCELCKFDFIMETQLKPLCNWEQLHMTKGERRKILCSVLFHLIAIACMLWSVYILVKRTAEEIRLGKNEELWRVTLLKYYTPQGKRSSAHDTLFMIHHTCCGSTHGGTVCLCASAGVLEWPFWTKLIVVAIGFTGGLIFMYIQCKVYLQLWRRLKAFNRIITVQNCPEKGLHRSQARANGRLEAVTVPVPAPQMDSDMSVEAAVAPV